MKTFKQFFEAYIPLSPEDNLNEQQMNQVAAYHYAEKQAKKLKDDSDTIDVYKMPNGKFEVNHSMNSSGRRSIERTGGILYLSQGKYGIDYDIGWENEV